MSSAVRALFASRRFKNEPAAPLAERNADFAASQRQQKPDYKVDLTEQHAECEANYVRLIKLLPEFFDRDRWHFEWGNGASQSKAVLRVIDRAPYTTTLTLTQSLQGESAAAVLRDLTAPMLTICLYHDVEMAEVVAWANHRRLRPRYSYPNSNMYQCDEKAQCNRFLTDWLTFCQSHGRVPLNLQDLGVLK